MAPLVLRALICIFLYRSIAAKPEQECNGVHTDCVSCASSTGGPIGGTCRWCPKDQQCHDRGAIFTNPCSEKENIIDPKLCGMPAPKFDPTLMKSHFAGSAAAYSHDPSACLSTQLSSYNFQVVRQLTVPCDLFSQNCSGFVAISKTRKVTLLGFRGTTTKTQLVIEALKDLLPSVPAPAGGSVSRYWYDALQALSPLLQDVTTAMSDTSMSLWITGHSLGGAIASLAHDTIMAQNKDFAKRDVSCYTFGQPRVGNYWYAMNHDIVAKNSFRVVNWHDIVPHLPWCKKLKLDGFPIPVCLGPVPPASGLSPYHHGTEIWLAGDQTTPVVCDDTDARVAPALPRNEAVNCSDGLFILDPICAGAGCVYNHTHYFGVEVADWGEKGCA